MCGIIGFSGTGEFASDPAVISLLMLWNASERGKDGTGIYMPEIGVLKSREEASKFLAKHYKKLGEVDNTVIAHVRKRSMGGYSDDDAQPFRVTTSDVDIIGAHNGHISNYVQLKEKFCDSNTPLSHTDSHALFQALAASKSFGPLLHYQGAVAMLMTDVRDPDKTIYAYRDTERPLFRGKRFEGMYFSSMPEPLNAADCSDVQEIKPNLVYIIKKGKVNHFLKCPARIVPISTPAVTYSSCNPTTSCMPTGKCNDAIGKWIRFGASLYQDPNVKYGNWYYCNNVVFQERNEGRIKEELLEIKMDTGRYRNYSPFLFDIYPYEFHIGTTARVMRDLSWLSGHDAGKTCARIGDIAIVRSTPSALGDVLVSVSTKENDELIIKHMSVNIADLLPIIVYNGGNSAKIDTTPDVDEDPYTTYMQQFAN